MRNELQEVNENLLLFSSEFLKQKEYWKNKLSHDIPMTTLLYSRRDVAGKKAAEKVNIPIPHQVYKTIEKLSKGSDLSIYIILAAVLKTLIHKYTANEDIVILSPVYQANITRETINDYVFIRDRLTRDMTFKELILSVKTSTIDAYRNQDYPFQKLVEYLFPPVLPSAEQIEEEDTTFISNIKCLLTNIHKESPAGEVKIDGEVVFSFEFARDEGRIKGDIAYDANAYKTVYIKQIARHFARLLESGTGNVNTVIARLPVLSEQEKEQLLIDFNNNRTDFPGDKTISRVIREQAEKTPGAAAIVFEKHQITYQELNRSSNQLAGFLKDRGIKNDQPVGTLFHRSPQMIESILAIWKAGGAYMPLDTDFPLERIQYMLKESRVSILLTENDMIKKYTFQGLQGNHLMRDEIHQTGVQPQITDFDGLPIPDRSLIDYEKYSRYIGLAPVKNCMSLQATRGCPYNCAYCHKIWPKSHVMRSAENFFNEVQFLYHIGVRRFAIIDDIFNLNKKNSMKFFQLVIDNGLEVQFFFPNGLRGDLLTKDYIDLMVRAGTVGLALALETASPRLQRLIGKHLNLEKLSENIQYICKTYPHVILELFTMHGFPTETEEEALMTLEFIKRHRWIHFPYVEILKIFPNTDMEKLALQHGVSKNAILRSENLAYHQIPDTLPFDKTFTMKYQADFLNDYFFSKERLLHVLPQQLKLLTEDEIVQKYNSYLPIDIHCFTDLLEFAGIRRDELGGGQFPADDNMAVPGLNEKLRRNFPSCQKDKDALRLLLLDLSQFFSGEVDMLYDVVEPPLGLMALMTYLNQQLGAKIKGKIAKSRIDFDSYEELNVLLNEFKPDVIGIRTLTFHKDFFHKTAAMIRHWGIDIPVIAGGPYATSSCKECLQGGNIDLVVLGEGEVTLYRVIEAIIKSNKQLPEEKVLKDISGIAFVPVRGWHPQPIIVSEVVKDIGKKKVARETKFQKELIKSPAENVEAVNFPVDLAYIIFTSGSTGKPRGAMVEHRGMMNHIQAKVHDLQLSARSIIAQNAAPTFDISVWQFFTALTLGGRTVIYPDELIMEPYRLLGRLVNHAVNILEVVPSYLSILLECQGTSDQRSHLHYLDYLLVTGEEIKPRLVKKWFEEYPAIKMVNAYGPTEASDDITHHIMNNPPETDRVPIGKPLQNLDIYILDQNMQLCPVGVKGEICVSGVGVGRGYLNNPEMTAEKFDHDLWDLQDYQDGYHKSYRSYKSYVLYKTGDLGRWLVDGTIEFFGRKDYQVKIRGFRIELGEIESQLSQHRGIKEAVVIDREDKAGNKYLCAYVVPDPGFSPGSNQLREFLSGSLPDYMVPSYFIIMEDIPLTSNGKTDRKAFPLPELESGHEYTAPRDEIEETLVSVWGDVLEIDKEKISIDSSFFELGGHSLKATILMWKINKALQVEVPLAELFRDPTIRALAQYIRFETSNRDNIAVTGTETRNSKDKDVAKGVSKTRDDNLVLIRKGDTKVKEKPDNLFLVHPGSGEVEGFVELCNHLGNTYNYWGIRAIRVEAYAPENITIKKIAQTYLKMIMQIQTHGPYYIVGRCAGGSIAFEMVRQLEKKGEKIAFFALVNAHPPEKSLAKKMKPFSRKSEIGMGLQLLPENKLKLKLRQNLNNLADLSQLWHFIVSLLEESNKSVKSILKFYEPDMLEAMKDIDQMSIKELINYLNTIRTYSNARNAYIPKGKINTETHFFRPVKTYQPFIHYWNYYCHQPVKIYDVHGSYKSMFKMPDVVSFSRLFDEVLSRCKTSQVAG